MNCGDETVNYIFRSTGSTIYSGYFLFNVFNVMFWVFFLFLDRLESTWYRTLSLSNRRMADTVEFRQVAAVDSTLNLATFLGLLTY